MLILKQSTSVDIRVGPFVDATDGVTPETGITLGAADQAEVLKANGAATVAMAGAFTAVTGADGWYDYTVATGDVDTVGEVVFVVQDSSVCLPVFKRGYVVEEAVYDQLYAAGATGSSFTDESKIASGTAQAATGTTLQLASGETFADDELIGATVVITGGTTGVGQSRIITDYVSSTDTATVDTWTTTPTGTVTYAVYATPPGSTSAPVPVNATQVSGTSQTAGDLAALITTVDTVVDAIKVITDALPDSGALTSIAQGAALATVDANVDSMVAGIIEGTAATGTLSTTQVSSDLTGYTDDQLIGRIIIWLTGNAAGEATDITDYASTNGVLTFTALTTAPADGDTFKIV